MNEEIDTSQLGRDMRERLLGADGRAALASMARRSPKIARWMVQLFGETYGDPLLDLRTRSLCTLTALVALGHEKPLANHFRGALRIGVTSDELAELIAQLVWYVGLPGAVTAMGVLDEVLEGKGSHAEAPKGLRRKRA